VKESKGRRNWKESGASRIPEVLKPRYRKWRSRCTGSGRGGLEDPLLRQNDGISLQEPFRPSVRQPCHGFQQLHLLTETGTISQLSREWKYYYVTLYH